jgi:hypothetical protein
MVFNELRVVFEIQVQKEFADKHPRAMLGRDDVRVFAEPAETCTHSPGFVHRWLNINADLSFSLGLLLADP